MTAPTPKTRQEFVACYEAFFWLRGYVAHDHHALNQEYRTNFTLQDWDYCLKEDTRLQAFLEERAVPNPYKPQPVLTPKQLDFLRLVFDPTDPSPLSAKQRKAKVSPAEYSAWMRDENFISLLRSEADNRFQNGRTQVLSSLERESLKGNVSAIKLYLTITGDYSPASNSPTTVVNVNQDMRQLTQKLLEILQRHVSPETLLLVHEELQAALFPAVTTAASPKSARLPRASVPALRGLNSPVEVLSESSEKQAFSQNEVNF